MQKRGLGKGLGALIPGANEKLREVVEIKINDVEPGEEQPRKNFDDEGLEALTESIKVHGIVQPIIVTKEGLGYKIVAGERRWRAARMAGFKTVPAIIKEYAKRDILEVALIENIQRQDLNAVEEAEAFKRLIEEYKLKQEEVAVTVGKSRSAVANAIRLLSLDKRVKEMIVTGELSGGHARVLVGVENAEEQVRLANDFIKKELSVRAAENLMKKTKDKKTRRKKDQKEKYIQDDITERLKRLLGTKVSMEVGKTKGKIVIEYFSRDELERLLELFFKIDS